MSIDPTSPSYYPSDINFTPSQQADVEFDKFRDELKTIKDSSDMTPEEKRKALTELMERVDTYYTDKSNSLKEEIEQRPPNSDIIELTKQLVNLKKDYTYFQMQCSDSIPPLDVPGQPSRPRGLMDLAGGS
jgi:hypothetical protein